jgi:hypothetical protein
MPLSQTKPKMFGSLGISQYCPHTNEGRYGNFPRPTPTLDNRFYEDFG